jgi:glycosyltransferase involved in cell wall biosynthesis
MRGELASHSPRIGNACPAVLFVIRDLGRAGAQRQLIELAKGLAALGSTVTIVAWRRSDNELSVPISERLVVRWIELVDERSMLELVRRIAKEIDDASPDVVHGYMPVENLVSTAAVMVRRRRPRLVWGIRASAVERGAYGIGYRLLILLQSLFAFAADLVIANSVAGRSLAGTARPGRRVVIPNGIDTERFSPGSLAIGRARRRESGEPKTLVLVGRLDPMKGIDVFLEALGIVRARGVDCRAIVLGSGSIDYRGFLLSVAASSGVSDNVEWRPASDDVIGAYAQADVVVSASRYGEGFSNVVAEALACGLPVVATDVGDARRILSGFGWLVPPGSAERLADAIVSALGDQPSSAPQERAEWIRSEFSVERLVARTLAAMQDEFGALPWRR